MSSAMRPDFFSKFPSLKQDEEAKKKGATEEERMYYGMINTKGFMLFTDKKNELLKDLDALIDGSIATGASYEEIGKNTLVMSLVKGIINRLWNITEDAKEACERPEGTK